MTLRQDCPTCIGYALVDADLTEHEVEAGASFDDQYEVITDLPDAHVERAHGDVPSEAGAGLPDSPDVGGVEDDGAVGPSPTGVQPAGSP
ncbi:hypothetical protein ACWDTQ_31220 [Streptomyces cellulosae]